MKRSYDVLDSSGINSNNNNAATSAGSTAYPVTAAYANPDLAIKNYRTLDEAIAANDLLGAVKFLLIPGCEDSFSWTDSHINFLKNADIYGFLRDVFKARCDNTWQSRLVELPKRCTDTTLEAWLYILKNTTIVAGLDISSYQANELHVIKTLNVLSTLTTVEHLHFVGTYKMTEPVAKALAEMLSKNKTLTEICVHWDMSEVFPHIITAMKTNTTLTSLEVVSKVPPGASMYFQRFSLKAADLIDFAKILETNTTLTTLSLAGSDVPDDVAKAFAVAFAKNRTLQSIDMSECMISEQGFYEFVSAWYHERLAKKDAGALKTISFSGNDPKAWELLLSLQKEFQELQSNFTMYFDSPNACYSCRGGRPYQELPKPAPGGKTNAPT